jgi:phosphoribosyl 1,2-cyclic phosphodiesterase
MGHYLKFWGTRGSCPVSGPQYRKFGGNTSCLELRYGDTLIIVDAGTGIRPLGKCLVEEGIREIHLFFSHLHWDHLLGFPFFQPIYQKDVQITIWAPHGSGRSPEELFKELFAEEFFPVRLDQLPAKLEFRTIREGEPVSIGELQINFHPACHPYETLCFEFRTPRQVIGYVSDNELISPFQPEAHESLIEFFHNCDLFIHEAQYNSEEHLEKVGWGHSCSEGVLTLVGHLLPAKWLVIHHDPDHTDADLKALCKETKKTLRKKRINCPVEWIVDGTVVELV